MEATVTLPKPYYDRDGITIYHADCMEVLPQLGRFDLLLTDPPYGISLKEHGRTGYDWSVTGDQDQRAGEAVLSWAVQQGLPQAVFCKPEAPMEADSGGSGWCGIRGQQSVQAATPQRAGNLAGNWYR